MISCFGPRTFVCGAELVIYGALGHVGAPLSKRSAENPHARKEYHLLSKGLLEGKTFRSNVL